MSVNNKANFQICPDLLFGLNSGLNPIQLWSANQVNVPTAPPAVGYQSDSDYGYGDSSPEYMGENPTSFLDDLNENFPDAENAEPIKKECLGNEEFNSIVPHLQDVFALMSKMPDSEFFFNLDESILKDTDENAYISYNNCSPESPGESSCDDGYSSDEILDILSNSSASPAPTEASPEEAYIENALLPSPKQEEVQVVPTSPSHPLSQPLSKPAKPARTSGRRKRGPRSLTLNNGNGPMQLWQFLLKLLIEGSVGLVQWTHDEPFEFKLLNPTAVATMWGKVKNKPSMNYEKLSRGLRYYYGKKILEKVHGKRYVYQFQCDIPKILGYDPTATDPKQNVEDAVCDSPGVAFEIADTYEECPSSVSSDDSANDCWEIGPGLW